MSGFFDFADLNCTAFAVWQGEPVVSERARKALVTRTNLVPVSMLRIRRDTPKRVAAYAKRGVGALYVDDAQAGDDQRAAIRVLQGRVNAAIAFQNRS